MRKCEWLTHCSEALRFWLYVVAVIICIVAEDYAFELITDAHRSQSSFSVLNQVSPMTQ